VIERWVMVGYRPNAPHHGWPLSADDWDTQMLYFAVNGYRVIAHDRRGHGRSSQVAVGHDMDHYAADIAAVVEHLDLRNAVHIGHTHPVGRNVSRTEPAKLLVFFVTDRNVPLVLPPQR